MGLEDLINFIEYSGKLTDNEKSFIILNLRNLEDHFERKFNKKIKEF